MNLFSSPKSYLGVDLGTSAIKIVELQNKSDHALLLTYGYVEQSIDVVRSSSEAMENQIVAIIKNIYRQSRMVSKKVVAALPSFAVFSSIISLPAMEKNDLSQAIRWEAKKFIPLPIEDMVLDWKIVPSDEDQPLQSDKTKPASAHDAKNRKVTPDNFLAKIISKNNLGLGKKHGFSQAKKEDNIKILLTAAPKNLVARYMKIFEGAGLELLSLETESFALERSLVGGDHAPVMIIDIGAVATDIAIINNGIPILTRSIDVGGVTITKSLMNNLNVDMSRAEQFKRDIGFSKLAEQNLPEIIKLAINPIINEVKYCLDIYLSQGREINIEKIILTGGSAWLPELPDYLAKILDIKVIIGDPWDRVVYPLELKPVLTEIGPRFSVAVGLAMREL